MEPLNQMAPLASITPLC